MDVDLVLYIIAFLLAGVLAWVSSLYYLFLNWGKSKEPVSPELSPSGDKIVFHVVIPCYQEGEYILAKLKNTASLKYPSDLLRVYIVDGGSTDRTLEIAREFCLGHPYFELLTSHHRGKVPQINRALEKIKDGIVLITDVDGQLEPDALEKLSAVYRDPGVGCAGAYVTLRNPLGEDLLFWQHQNAMRLLESSRGHSSVMVAVAYSFRRQLFDHFPEDVIADDVYVAFTSNTRGYRSLYCPRVRARELRSGSNRGEMFRHKLRKLNANMLELKRFLPAGKKMKGLWKLMFLTKCVQSWLVAPLLLLLLALFLFTVFHAVFPSLIFWGGVLLMLIALQASAQSVLKQFILSEQSRSLSLPTRFSYFLLFPAVLIAGFFRFFFVRQTSSYRKVK